MDEDRFEPQIPLTLTEDDEFVLLMKDEGEYHRTIINNLNIRELTMLASSLANTVISLTAQSLAGKDPNDWYPLEKGDDILRSVLDDLDFS